MLTSFTTALSALNANETAIDIVGDNLANLNTPGFKNNDVEFKDMMSQSIGSTEVGYGVATPSSRRDFGQGAIQPGSGSMTAAIQGQGFFVYQGSGGEMYYSRVGDFKLDSTGKLTDQSGNAVLGWNASNGAINTNGSVVPIQLPAMGLLPPKATQNMSLDLNLDSNAAVGTVYSTPVYVVDSLGTQHALTMTFTKSATGWDYAASVPASDEAATGFGITYGNATQSLAFDGNGVLDTTAATGDTITIAGLGDGAADLNIKWSFVDSDGVTPRITQYNAASAPSGIDQDGCPASQLLDVKMGDDGQVIAEYSNGQQLAMAQVALASIRNPDTLVNVGNNNFQATAATSSPAIGASGTGGRGTIEGNASEASNVDIAREFTNLIVYQRGYQAASRVITTSDTLSQETINLVRQ